MQEIFENIKERLGEELKLAEEDAERYEKGNSNHFKYAKARGYATAMDVAIEIVNQVAREVVVAKNATANDGLITLPKVAFDRMIARMESESERDIYEEESLFINVRDAARIVREIVREYVPDKNVGEIEEFCEWRLCDEEANVYDTACGNSEMLFDGSPINNNYSFCPYCGKKIKLLECTNCKWYWQNNDTENTCSGSATTCIEYLEVAPYQPKGEK